MTTHNGIFKSCYISICYLLYIAAFMDSSERAYNELDMERAVRIRTNEIGIKTLFEAAFGDNFRANGMQAACAMKLALTLAGKV